MKTILATLNAKYIHTSLALRWLYVANKDRFDISFREYTIKENIEKIAQELSDTGSDIIGLSVYIWNVSHTKELVRLLKERNPQLIIVLGGPEVMYEPEYFLENWNIDYVIGGEGEFVLGELLETLENEIPVQIAGVSSKGNINKVIVQADPEKLASLDSPYMLEEDKPEIGNKLVYFETSRGCPYQCQYCLSSLEKGVRYFPQEYIVKNLRYLIESDAKQIKFLDRTFNLNKEHTHMVFDYLIANYRPNLSCQFEVYADLLKDETITYLNTHLPKDYFRFEIGIQSTYEPTNVAVKRKQDFPLLAGNVKKIMQGGKIDLHLDLIAGLPYETFDRFRKSFNDVFALGGKEVQLGFLKMLRGTNLRRFAEKYGYKYDEDAPYEIEYNADISRTELDRIHEAEHALEKFWNSGRFVQTMEALFADKYKGRYFEFFDELGQFYKEKNYPHRGYQLEDLFRYLHAFLIMKGIDLFSTLRTDYYGNFTRRPQGFWEDTLGKQKRKQLLYQIGQDKAFLKKYNLTRKIVEKQTALDYISDNELLLTIFLADGDKAKRLSVGYVLTEGHRKQ
ncbi:anaerobic magnesium-protoporphyrin IX monomethyl ester cyclase [Dysgonomonas sp. PFB1-18]|uniref:B12-binding domain-containing radical SAM protein n=1 Tax=unclassified Dysgonomonas TaxID=2630389 RepID=UPI0024753E2B|nr:MULTISPECIES: radical SAM protein [unclassified Dysgonomonas]MDH6309693.1 anaerobic magnesium-protoporphyrin IX monomethyl ester cyclase [Dysgonomonas sp. PF1-14]MDH6339299.1 anaerobic magnesium-protoporphyrin IX monomethyl ester cyclase [Dysgonomonas sp. PF1-16]MDH6380798.1 anaerobic magnesium-protoporphyrin IX monomethyl ester cyclase [Dysgonomonas sp. PFB1-18]MDH6398294.1 anaerobic magnesium-protoporphyrin IX monomethyl ester cyclase [Dysgonomonas sp. PF1-23]